MKSLNTIRKIHKYKMDSLLKEVAIMEVELNANQNSLHELSELERSEIENFSASDFAFTLEKYIAYVNEKKQKHIENIKKLEESIEKTKIMVHDEFSELKKIEHVIMLKNKKAKIKAEKIESTELEENTIVRHNRNFF